MGRAVYGFALAVVIGLAVGIADLAEQDGARAFGPIITGMQTMPAIAWFPFAIIFFGLTTSAILFVIVIGTAPAIAIAVIAGSDNIPPLLRRAAKTMGFKGFALYRHVILPASLPVFVTGLKQGWAFAWRSLMSGELVVIVANTASIGVLLENAQNLSDMPSAIAIMIVILALGIFIDGLFTLLDNGFVVDGDCSASTKRDVRVAAPSGCGHLVTRTSAPISSTAESSLAEAISHSESGGAEGGPPFEWDIGIDVGDMSGAHHSLPDDAEGEEVASSSARCAGTTAKTSTACAAITTVTDLTNPRRGGGASGLIRWVSTPNSPESMPGRDLPIDGSWERYSFRVGNLLFLMMSDRNEPSQKVGRGTLGGNPGGVVSGETFQWWPSMVVANPDPNIVSVHHYVLKNTTVASGEWEGVRGSPMANWWSTTTGHSNRARPRAHRTCTGWTASRIRPRSSRSWPARPAGWRCGLPDIPIPTPRTHSAGRRTSSTAGAHGFSMSHR